MLFTRIIAVSALTFLAHAQSQNSSSSAPTPIPIASISTYYRLWQEDETKASQQLQSYFSHLTTEPGYSAATQVLATAVPPGNLAEITSDPTGHLKTVFSRTAPASWYTGLPTSVQGFISSVEVAEASIVAQVATAPIPTNVAPTNVAKVAGVVLAAGVAVVAML